MGNMLKEFKEFAMKGNVVDMAVGVVIGGAFGNIVTSIVNDLFTPLIACVFGDVDFTHIAVHLKGSGENAITLNIGNFLQVVFNFIIVAICLAFLCYNFYPASTFMGDSGALFLGLLIGTVSLAGVVRTQSLVINLVPLVIAGIPVIDTLSAFIRRTRQHQRFDQADLGHIHHRLVNAGFGQRKAVVILYACTAALAIVGLLISSVSGPMRWAIFGLLFVVVFVAIWRVGLFKPVLQHHYDNRGNVGPRKPREKAGAGKHAAPAVAEAAPSKEGGES